MRSVNKTIIIGNVTREPEAKTMPNGQKVVTFSVATNKEWTTKAGDEKSMTEYHSVVVWAKLAELVEKYLVKGKYIYIEGYLKTRMWEAEGHKNYRTEIVALDIVFLDKRDDTDSHYDSLSEMNQI